MAELSLYDAGCLQIVRQAGKPGTVGLSNDENSQPCDMCTTSNPRHGSRPEVEDYAQITSCSF
jgi:hypothetical protein